MISIFGSSNDESIYNMVARIQATEPVKGVCDNDNIIAILPFPGNGQIKAEAPMFDDEIAVELNSKVVHKQTHKCPITYTFNKSYK